MLHEGTNSSLAGPLGVVEYVLPVEARVERGGYEAGLETDLPLDLGDDGHDQRLLPLGSHVEAHHLREGLVFPKRRGHGLTLTSADGFWTPARVTPARNQCLRQAQSRAGA